jgi:hypothetical protein
VTILRSDVMRGVVFSLKPPRWTLFAVLVLALEILSATAWFRGTEYDEGYTRLVTAGTPRPVWPPEPFLAGDMKPVFDGHSSLIRIAVDLRHTDVHPPLYFWAVAGWRWISGPDLFGIRLLSVGFTLVALVALAGIAYLAGVPPVAALLVTLGCYGFTYTGAIARGFACAQALSLAGVLMVLLAETRRSAVRGLVAGLLLGAATLANYLAAFVGAAALLWLLLRRWRQPATWIAAGLGFAALLPADLWFFLAQRDSRTGQFPPFSLVPSLGRLAKYTSANVFGGLPLYVDGMPRVLIGAVLAVALVGLVLLVSLRWKRLGAPGSRTVLAMCAVAPPVGLILLGLVFNNTPIELRYIAFATPFFSLLVAGALTTLRPGLAVPLLAALLLVQSVSLAGMMLRPETMQPQAAATREVTALAGADGLVLVPYGDDGVGIAGAMVTEAPDWLHLYVVPQHATPEQIRAAISGAQHVVLALLGLDRNSRATLPAMEEAVRDPACWRPAGRETDAAAFDRVADAPGCASTAGR